MALSSAGGGAAGGDLSGLMGAMGGAGGAPGAGSVFDDLYPPSKNVPLSNNDCSIPMNDQLSKEYAVPAIPFSLQSVKDDCDMNSAATSSTCSSSSLSSSSPTPDGTSSMNNNNHSNHNHNSNVTNTYKYEYKETIRMPIIAEECMKWQTIRKTNLEAKLQSQQDQRRQTEQQSFLYCWIVCILGSMIYDGKMGLILATLPLAMISVK